MWILVPYVVFLPRPYPGDLAHIALPRPNTQIYPSTSGQLERLASHGHPSRHFLSCPVFGPPPLAASAQLMIVMAGNIHAKRHVAHVLVPSVGRKVLDMGNDVEKAGKFKLIGNSMILGSEWWGCAIVGGRGVAKACDMMIVAIELLSESMTLADRSGVGADKVYRLYVCITESLADFLLAIVAV